MKNIISFKGILIAIIVLIVLILISIPFIFFQRLALNQSGISYRHLDKERLYKLRNDPMAILSYPNAIELLRKENGSNGYNSFSGVESSPSINRTLGTNAPDEEIYRFLLESATFNGWTLTRGPAEGLQYFRSSIHFKKEHLGFLDVHLYEQQKLQNTMLSNEVSLNGHRTIIIMRLSANPLDPPGYADAFKGLFYYLLPL